jgi:hypothetical protein
MTDLCHFCFTVFNVHADGSVTHAAAVAAADQMHLAIKKDDMFSSEQLDQ